MTSPQFADKGMPLEAVLNGTGIILRDLEKLLAEFGRHGITLKKLNLTLNSTHLQSNILKFGHKRVITPELPAWARSESEVNPKQGCSVSA